MKARLVILLVGVLGLLQAINPEYYPGIPADHTAVNDKVLLDAKHWKVPAGFSVTSDCDGLTAVSRVVTQWSNEFAALDSIPVTPGKLLKVTTRFYLPEVQPGSLFALRLQLLDQNGKVLVASDVAEGRSSSPEKLIWKECYLQIPAGAVSARPTLKFFGNPITAKIVTFELKTGDKKDALPIFPLKIPFSNKHLNDNELTQALSARQKVNAKVATNGDMVEFLIDGKAVPIKIYKNNLTTTIANYPEFMKKTPAMQKAGFNIFTVGVYLGLPCHPRTANSVWQKDGSYQVEIIQQAMRQILKYSPDAMIFLDFFVTPHEGWSEANQDEVVQWVDGRKAVFSGGGRIRELTNEPPKVLKPIPHEPWSMPIWIPSYFSEKFTKDASDAIFNIFTELEKTPESKALAGVYLIRGVDMQWFDLFAEIPATATEKAIYPLADYSPASRDFFRNFLRGKYDNDIDKLRAAWNDSAVNSFDDIQIPAHEELFPKGPLMIRKSAGRDRISDFIESRGDGMSKQFLSFCRAIKKATNNRLLVGAYRAEGAIVSYPFLTQQCSKQMYAAPEVDFFASCPGGRTPENPVMPSLLNGSLRLHGKLAVTELDFRTPWVWNWGPWNEPIYYKTHDEREFQQRSMRAQLFASASGGAFHAYDMDGNWYDTPMAINAWTENNRIYDLRKPRPLSDKRIALFYSEHYWEYMALNSTRAYAHIVKNLPREAVTRSGVDADSYLLDDIFHPDFKAPRVLWFVDSLELTPEKAAEIRRKFANSGRVLVWMWAPGIGTTEDIGKVAGFHLERAPQADGKAVVALKGSTDPLMAGVENLLLPKYLPWGMGPAWQIKDPKAVILGNYIGTNIPAMGVKRYSSHTEIFIGQGGHVTPRLARNIALEAGAHCWLYSDDPAVSAGNLLIVSAASTGGKVISLPDDISTVKSLTGQHVRQDGSQVTCDLEYGDVLVLELLENNL